MDLIRKLRRRSLALLLAACATPDLKEPEDTAPRLHVDDLSTVLEPACVTLSSTGELACPVEAEGFVPPPSGTVMRQLASGSYAVCGLESSPLDDEPTSIGCWHAVGWGEHEYEAWAERQVPNGDGFSALTVTWSLTFCAAGPGVAPICWGRDAADPVQPREELASATDVIEMSDSPCGLCILTADGVVTCNATEPVRGIDDCTHPLGEQVFTAIDGNYRGICGIPPEGGLRCAEYRVDPGHYVWNSAIPASVEWASFEVGWAGGCGVSTAGEAVCFGTREPYPGCWSHSCGEGWRPDDVDITAWYRQARFEGTYSKVIPGLGYVYALRPTGELELHWDPDCATYDDVLSCPPDPSLWDALGYTEPMHPQQIPGWVQFP